MTTAEKIAVMQAFEEGKEIQVLSPVLGAGWVDVVDPSWDWSVYDYRVKPELEYRPYNDTEELIADWKERFGAKDWPLYSMPLIWLIEKGTKDKNLVSGFNEKSISIFSADTGFDSINLSELFICYSYLDGSICGKEGD